MLPQGTVETLDDLTVLGKQLPGTVKCLIKPSNGDVPILLQVLDNFLGLVIKHTPFASKNLQHVIRSYLVHSSEIFALLHHLLCYSVVASHSNRPLQDLIDLLLLGSIRAESPLHTSRCLILGRVSSKCLIKRDLVQSFISRGCDGTAEDVHKVVLLDDI